MICEYCKKDCAALGSHLKNSHNITNLKEYYDTFIKRENEGICPVCGKETTFRGLTKGYLTYCSSKCSNSAKEVVVKKKQTTKEHFGDENYRNIEQSPATRLSLYGQFNSQERTRKISATKQGKTVEEIAEATEKSRQTRDSKWCQWRAPDTTAKIANTKLQNHGSASKLFKHFLADHEEITTIVSYADRRWSTGKLYESLQFAKEKTTPPNYFYVKQFERENRLKYQKHILVATGADQTKTEQEIMCEKGYRRIYDCGTLKYKYNKYATL